MKTFNFLLQGLLLIFASIKICTANEQSFIVSFQPDIKGSDFATNNSWIDINQSIPKLNEFTICHQIKIKFFNFKYAACLWSYCTIRREGDKMKCLRLCLNGVFKTANRQTILLAQMPSYKEPRYLSNIVASLVQRRWSHICWSFSLILKGESKFYLNGNEIGTQLVDTTDMTAAVFV